MVLIAITRRGFGASSHPDFGFDARTLARDVSGVLQSMHLDPAFVAGHSISAIELTALGTHHADQVHQLVYLDTYCNLPAADVAWEALMRTPEPGMPTPVRPGAADTATVEGYVAFVHRTRGVPIPEADIRARYATDGWDETIPPPYRAVFAALGTQPCAAVQVPALLLLGNAETIDHAEPWIRADTAAWPAQLEFDRRIDEIFTLVQAGLATVQPSWRVEFLRAGHHWVFVSHADEVERLMREFLR